MNKGASLAAVRSSARSPPRAPGSRAQERCPPRACHELLPPGAGPSNALEAAPQLCSVLHPPRHVARCPLALLPHAARSQCCTLHGKVQPGPSLSRSSALTLRTPGKHFTGPWSWVLYSGFGRQHRPGEGCVRGHGTSRGQRLWCALCRCAHGHAVLGGCAPAPSQTRSGCETPCSAAPR